MEPRSARRNGSSPLLDATRLGVVLLSCTALGCTLSPEAAAKQRRSSGEAAAPERAAPVAPAASSASSASAWSDDDGERAALRRATDEALGALERRAAKPEATPETARVARGLALLREALAERPDAFPRALAARFAAAPAHDAFVTGYHEPTLAARRSRDARFRYPLYRLPGGPPRALPSRAEIEDGALADRGLELFWTDDPIELFFLQVQGSGRLRLGDGTIVRVGYAGNNGRTYRAIGAVLVERGVFEPGQVTAPVIKEYLRTHPAEAPAIMRTNPRYVFFQVREGRADEGPTGALGVPLVPYRSVAVDPKVVPLGSIGHLRVALPGGDTFSALVIAMDTGTAIAGAGRVDLFCGPDDEAARVAGKLRHRGELTWLEPRR